VGPNQTTANMRGSLLFFLFDGSDHQSAKLFLQSSELELPHPLSRRRVCPPPHPLVQGGKGHTRWRERVPIPTRGHSLWCSVYIQVLRGSDLLVAGRRVCPGFRLGLRHPDVHAGGQLRLRLRLLIQDLALVAAPHRQGPFICLDPRRVPAFWPGLRREFYRL
jgi:hypothetical protein